MQQKTDAPNGPGRKVVRTGAPMACDVCGFELERNLVACSGCDSLYHRDCWDRNDGCAWYACRLTDPPPQSIPARVELLPLARPRSVAWWAAAAAAVGTFLMMGGLPPASRGPAAPAIRATTRPPVASPGRAAPSSPDAPPAACPPAGAADLPEPLGFMVVTSPAAASATAQSSVPRVPAPAVAVSLSPAPVATAVEPASARIPSEEQTVERSTVGFRLVPDGRGGFRFEMRP